MSGGDLFTYRVVNRGRRAYRCEGCRQMIERGTRHIYGFGVLDGCLMYFRVCISCGLDSSDTRPFALAAQEREA